MKLRWFNFGKQRRGKKRKVHKNPKNCCLPESEWFILIHRNTLITLFLKAFITNLSSSLIFMIYNDIVKIIAIEKKTRKILTFDKKSIRKNQNNNTQITAGTMIFAVL